jgi:hypothetical protein
VSDLANTKTYQLAVSTSWHGRQRTLPVQMIICIDVELQITEDVTAISILGGFAEQSEHIMYE